MEDLKLPIIRGQLPPNKSLPPDEYLKFIIFYLKYISPTSRGEKVIRPTPVNVLFHL
jgi:hypothetical protein